MNTVSSLLTYQRLICNKIDDTVARCQFYNAKHCIVSRLVGMSMATHRYDVHLDDGKVYEVTTPHHHDDHDEAAFSRHLLDVIKSSIAGVVAGTVLRFVFRGRQ